MRALLRWHQIPRLESLLPPTFERWLGFVHPQGFPLKRPSGGDPAADKKRLKETRTEIARRAGHELEMGTQIERAGCALTVINDGGLLRLGRFALAVISHLPRRPYVHALAVGCVAEAIMNHPDKYQLFAWTLRSSSEPLWSAVHSEVQRLLADDSLAGQQAAHRLLSFNGSETAHRVQQTLPADLFPKNPLVVQHERDPCISFFRWTRTDCEKCLSRADVPTRLLAERLARFCIDPELPVPADLGQRIVPLAQSIPIHEVWSQLGVTAADLAIRDLEPALCAYAPEAFADLMRCIVRDAASRRDMPLRQLCWHLVEHTLLFGPDEWRALRTAWDRLHQTAGPLAEPERVAEHQLFEVLLETMTAEEQLDRLLARPDEASDLLAFQRHFAEITDWQTISPRLTEGMDTKSLTRVLWFVSRHPEQIPAGILERTADYVEHEDTVVRTAALDILYGAGSPTVLQGFLRGKWAWGTARCRRENHLGSLLLCEYGEDLAYEELRRRVDPAYLGYAIHCRGLSADEAQQYAEDVHRVWGSLSTPQLPALPPSFPLSETGCGAAAEAPAFNYIHLAPEMLPRRFVFKNPDATWGGGARSTPDAFPRDFSLEGDRFVQDQTKALSDGLEQQWQAGNTWFGICLPTHGLDWIVAHRPDLVETWLAPVLETGHAASRLLAVAAGFYEALCKVLLRQAPERGVALYRRLKKSQYPVRFVAQWSGTSLIEQALFAAPAHPAVEVLWEERLANCCTDRELLELVLVAQSGQARTWLWSVIARGVVAPVPFQQAQVLMLLAFIDGSQADDMLSRYVKASPQTWLDHVAAAASRYRQNNCWARHWYVRFLGTADDIASWAAFRLFLRCVDSRYWYWRSPSSPDDSTDAAWNRRLHFLEANKEAIKRHAQENEKPLTEEFLAQKVLKGDVWPWLEQA